MLRETYERFDHFYVVNDPVPLREGMTGRTYFIRHSERDLFFFVNLVEALRILRRERPSVILSTGAGPAVPFAIAGRLMSIKSIFVETFARVTNPSLTGRLMYWLAAEFFYQWPDLARHFPRGTCGGPIA